MFETFLVYLFTFFKILVGFLVIVAHLKLSNKSQTMQLTPIDFIGNFILGGIIGGVIYNPDISFVRYFAMLISAIVLISLLNMLSTKFMPARQLVMGSTTPIIVNGAFQLDSISNKDTKFDLIEFTAMLRTKGIFSLEEVAFAQIEANGGLTVIKKGDGYLNFLLVKSGQLLTTQLDKIGKSEEWLMAELNSLEIYTLDEIFLVEFSQNQRLYIVKSDGSSVTKIVQPISIDEVKKRRKISN